MKQHIIDNIKTIDELMPFVEEYSNEMGYKHPLVVAALDRAAEFVYAKTGVDIRTEKVFRKTVEKKGLESKQLILTTTGLVKKVLMKTYDHEGTDPASYITNLVELLSHVSNFEEFGDRLSGFISKDTTYIPLTGASEDTKKRQPPNLLPYVFTKCFPAILACKNGSVDDLVYRVIEQAETNLENNSQFGTMCFDKNTMAQSEQTLLECIESRTKESGDSSIEYPFSSYDELRGLLKQEGPKALAKQHKFTRLKWSSNAKSDWTKVSFYIGDQDMEITFRGKERNNKVKDYLIALGGKIVSGRKDQTGDTSYLMSNLQKHW